MATADSRVPTDQSGAWLPLREAARQLGISEKTTRRRVKAGTLEGRQQGTQHGPAWQVWVPAGLATAGTVDTRGTQAVQGADLAELVELVERQQQTILELSGRCGYLQAELAQARATILALEAPQRPVDTTLEDEGSSREATGLWGRFLGWVYG